MNLFLIRSSPPNKNLQPVSNKIHIILSVKFRLVSIEICEKEIIKEVIKTKLLCCY